MITICYQPSNFQPDGRLGHTVEPGFINYWNSCECYETILLPTLSDFLEKCRTSLLGVSVTGRKRWLYPEWLTFRLTIGLFRASKQILKRSIDITLLH